DARRGRGGVPVRLRGRLLVAVGLRRRRRRRRLLVTVGLGGRRRGRRLRVRVRRGRRRRVGRAGRRLDDVVVAGHRPRRRDRLRRRRGVPVLRRLVLVGRRVLRRPAGV